VPIAVSVAGTGIIQSLINWASRNQQFGHLGSRSAAERLLVLGSGIAFGAFGLKAYGLIYAQMLGIALSIGYLLLKARDGFSGPSVSLRGLLQKYADFPRQYFFSTLLSAGAAQLMAFLFGSTYAKEDL